MAYVKQTWENSAATPLSSTRLNKLETQYDESIAEVAAQVGDATKPIGQALNTTFATAFADTAVTYDAVGNVSSVTDAGITTTFTYNSDGTVATDTRLGVTRAYTYSGGNLIKIEKVVS